ncbi:hypothetical protein KY289_017039 [Solanum tuberosum]|nr:hypothetical protein KY284_016837 [Solanum tuberosum]KAH0689681.1 hypothetical protein KY289_017039 [Solanum tuberosum]
MERIDENRYETLNIPRSRIELWDSQLTDLQETSQFPYRASSSRPHWEFALVKEETKAHLEASSWPAIYL